MSGTHHNQIMITTYSQTGLGHQQESDLKAMLLEPFLVVGSAAFWLLTLPLTAIALFCVKIYDTVTGLARRRANPLILRRGAEAEPVLSRRSSVRQA